MSLPSRQLTQWTPEQVDSTIRSASSGSLAQPARLCAEIMRDDRVRGVLSTRTLGLHGLPLRWEGVEPEGFYSLAPESELAKFQAWGLMLGVGLARVEPNGTFRAWSPEFLRQDQDRQWWVTTEQGERRLIPGVGWALYLPYGDQEPWFDGLWTALAIPWLVKRYGLNDRARASEVFGSAMVVGKAAEGASEEQRRRWLSDLRSLSRSSRLVLPDGYDIDLLEAQGQTWGIYSTSIDWADAAMTITIAGQIVTTMGQSGFSNGSIHETVAQSFIRFGAESLSTTLREQYVLPVWMTDAWPVWDVRPPNQARDRAAALEAFGKALLESNRALAEYGLIVDARKLAQESNIPTLPKASDDTSGALDVELAPTDVARILRVNEARRAKGFPDLAFVDGTPNPLGEKLIAELQAIVAPDEDTQRERERERERALREQQSSLVAASRTTRDVTYLSGVDVSTAPSSFRVFRVGENETDKGVILWDPSMFAAATKGRGRCMIDLEHLSLNKEIITYNPDAMGWFSFGLVDGELWALDVNWTDEGKGRIDARKQIYISPAVRRDGRGRVSSLINVALTALPAMHDIEPLVAASSDTSTKGTTKMPDELLQLLGLPPDATTEQVLAAISDLLRIAAEAASASGDETGAEAAEAGADAVAEAAADATDETAMAEGETSEDEEGEQVAASLLPRLLTEVVALSKRLDGIERSGAAKAKAQAIANPALPPWLRKWLGNQDPSVAVSLSRAIKNPPRVQPRRTNHALTVASLDADALKLCRLTGVSPEAFVAARNSEGR